MNLTLTPEQITALARAVRQFHYTVWRESATECVPSSVRREARPALTAAVAVFEALGLSEMPLMWGSDSEFDTALADAMGTGTGTTE